MKNIAYSLTWSVFMPFQAESKPARKLSLGQSWEDSASGEDSAADLKRACLQANSEA